VTWVTRTLNPSHAAILIPFDCSCQQKFCGQPSATSSTKRGVFHLIRLTCLEYLGGFLASSARQHLGFFLGAFFFSRFYGPRGSRLGYRADPEAAAPRSGPAGELPTS
jgi:hypothetical protein